MDVVGASGGLVVIAGLLAFVMLGLLQRWYLMASVRETDAGLVVKRPRQAPLTVPYAELLGTSLKPGPVRSSNVRYLVVHSSVYGSIVTRHSTAVFPLVGQRQALQDRADQLARLGWPERPAR